MLLYRPVAARKWIGYLSKLYTLWYSKGFVLFFQVL